MKTDSETIRRMLRNSNRLWHRMYYDGVVELPTCHISHYRSAYRLSYNAAHGLTSTDEGTFADIEKNFATLGIVPGFYTDPHVPENMESELRKRGYIYVPSEDERWFYYDVEDFVPSTCYVKMDPKRFYVSVFKPSSDDCERFLEIDAMVNNLSPELKERLNHGLHDDENDIDLRLILGYVDGKPVGTKAIGIIGDMAFTAEASTLFDCRRQGISTALTAEAVKIAKRQGAKSIIVHCDKENHTSQVHEKFGYKRLFTRRYFKKMG